MSDGARDYTEQIGRGGDYRDLRPTFVIVWLVDPLFPDLDRLHSTFEFRDRHTHALFGDQIAIHVLQLSSLSPPYATSGYDAIVQRWARFLVARDDSEFEQLAKEDPIMTAAKKTLEELSMDPAAQRLARERSDAIALYEIDLAMSRKLAKSEGKAEGKAEILLELLALRFGQPSGEIRARIGEATSDVLGTWAGRILTAPTLDAVFVP